MLERCDRVEVEVTLRGDEGVVGRLRWERGGGVTGTDSVIEVSDPVTELGGGGGGRIGDSALERALIVVVVVVVMRISGCTISLGDKMELPTLTARASI